jgi:hypothetical protein
MISFYNSAIYAQNNLPIQTESHWDVFLFFGILAICIGIFFFFLKRTDDLIDEEHKQTMTEQDKTKHEVKNPNDEEAAAIALAIHLYQSELHDIESFTITLQKVSRIYSPWSSKIYSLRQYPRH